MAYQNQCIGTEREQNKKVETGDLPGRWVNPKEHFNHDGKLIGTPREWFYLRLDPRTGVTFEAIQWRGQSGNKA